MWKHLGGDCVRTQSYLSPTNNTKRWSANTTLHALFKCNIDKKVACHKTFIVLILYNSLHAFVEFDRGCHEILDSSGDEKKRRRLEQYKCI